jgi:hypothetical protein
LTPVTHPINDKITVIHQLIAKKDYFNALDRLLAIFEDLFNNPNDDIFSMGLEILNAICDKSERIIVKCLEFIGKIIDLPQDWVRLEALLILTKIYAVTPEKFDLYVEKIEMKLYDNDKKVREAAANLIAMVLDNTIESNTYPDLYLSFIGKFKDESWIVRARSLEGTLRILKNHDQLPASMLEGLRQEIVTLLEDPDEEVRTLSSEVLKELCLHSDKQSNFAILSNLIKNEDWEIREKIIWVIGEIGGYYFQDYLPLFEQMIPMFADEIMMIQTKVIDAFVKIGQNLNGPRLFQFFLKYFDANNDDIKQGILESIIYISIHNTRTMIPLVISQLENPGEGIQEMIGNCLLKIYMEAPDRIEEEIARIYHMIDPDNWRQRLKTVRLLGHFCYTLRIKSIAVWTAINLKKWRENEKDLDVLDEIDTSLAKIKNVFEKFEEDIIQVEQKKNYYYEEIEVLQQLPRIFRDKAEELIRTKHFNEAELYLEEEGANITNRIMQFETSLYESEFKRFSVDIIEDWNDSKEEILEQVSDVKSFEYNSILDARSVYIEELEGQISGIRSRIEILKAEHNAIKDIDSKINEIVESKDISKTEELISSISSLRDRIFKLEFDVGQIWLNNLEFKDFLKEVTIEWIDSKLEIQQFLADMIQRINALKDTMDTGTEETLSLKKKITFEFLNQQFQNYVLQAIQNLRDIMEKFNLFEEPIKVELQKRHFREARQMLDLTINNLHSTIENHNREINKIYEEIDKINISLYSANEIRRHLNNWNEIKENLMSKINKFLQGTDDNILISEITEYQRIMNPIPLKHMGKSIGISLAKLKERLFELIKNHQIRAEIRDDNLIQMDQPKEERILNFFRKVNIFGTNIQILIRVYNPTRFFINDVSLTVQIPELLDLDLSESDLPEIYIKEFEPEAFRVLQWQFKVKKPSEKQYVVEKLNLDISYKNPFGTKTKIRKEMEIIL